MRTEYHGWFVLMCEDSGWADDDWEGARQVVRQAVQTLVEEAGDMACLDLANSGAPFVTLNGWTEDPTAMIEVLRLMCAAAPNCYGEVVLFDEGMPDVRSQIAIRNSKLLNSGSLRWREGEWLREG